MQQGRQNSQLSRVIAEYQDKGAQQKKSYDVFYGKDRSWNMGENGFR